MKATSPFVIHYVHDMQRAIRFYSQVFEVPLSFESPGWSTFSSMFLNWRYTYW